MHGDLELKIQYLLYQNINKETIDALVLLKIAFP